MTSRMGAPNGVNRSCRAGKTIAGTVGHALFVLLVIASVPAVAWSAEGRSYLDFNGGYKTGNFGTSVRSDLYYLDATIGYVSPRYDFSISVPYLTLSNNAGMMSTNTANGIGDIVLRGGLVLVPETENGFSLTSSLSVKVPTADENKGLGTGETDYGGFLGLRERVGRNRFSLTGGYIKVGSPAGVNLNDVYIYDIGYSRIFTSTELSVWYEGRRALFPSLKNPEEINVGFFHILSRDYSIKGSTFVGLNNGGPDFGLNLGIVRWF